MAGAEVPVQPFRRQLFFTGPFSHIPDPIPLVIDFHRAWYFRREGAGLLISGPKDNFPSFNLNVDYDAMVEVAENSMYRVPILEKAEIDRGWAGSYEISPDNHAILGEVPGIERVVPGQRLQRPRLPAQPGGGEGHGRNDPRGKTRHRYLLPVHRTLRQRRADPGTPDRLQGLKPVLNFLVHHGLFVIFLKEE